MNNARQSSSSNNTIKSSSSSSSSSDTNNVDFFHSQLVQIQTNPSPAGPDGLHYKHLALVEISSGSVSFLSSGEFVVTGVEGWDEEEGVVYFMGTGENDPGARQVQKD